MERLVCANRRCSSSAFRELRRLLTIQGDAGRTEPTVACDQELPVAAAFAKSVLDAATLVVERLWRDAEEGSSLPFRRNERMAADAVQSVLVLFKRREVAA